MPKPFAWSYSALDTYEQCPKKYYHLKVKKDFKEDFSGHAAEYGKTGHKAFELRLKSNKKLPLDFSHHEKMLAKIAAAPGEPYVEQRLALNRSLEATGYFDSDVWVRGQADYGVVNDGHAVIFDWKFGKMKAEMGQLELMAAMFMAYMPTLHSIDAAFYWAKDKQFTKIALTRDDLPTIWNKFLPRVERIENAIRVTEFEAKESGLCKNYCPIHTCPFNGRYNDGD